MILQDLKKIFQKSQNYSKKGLLVTLLHLVTKNLFYNKSWVFSKGSTWHRCVPCGGETRGNGSNPLCSET